MNFTFGWRNWKNLPVRLDAVYINDLWSYFVCWWRDRRQFARFMVVHPDWDMRCASHEMVNWYGG